MPRWFVELSARWYEEIEVEADTEEEAVEAAIYKADDSVRFDAIDWDVEYVESISD